MLSREVEILRPGRNFLRGNDCFMFSAAMARFTKVCDEKEKIRHQIQLMVSSGQTDCRLWKCRWEGRSAHVVKLALHSGSLGVARKTDKDGVTDLFVGFNESMGK